MVSTDSGPVTVPQIQSRKLENGSEKDAISALTAYDFTMARLIDEAGIDIVLVGDSLGSVIQGHDTTLPVTLDEIIYHSRCVRKGVQRALVVADMPFLSYQISKEEALRSAGRLIKEAGVSAVKLEGGVQFSETIKALVQCEIPVMGHVGLTPQSYHRMGGHKVQGRKHSQSKDSSIPDGSYERVLADAKAVCEAGAFSLVIEGVPEALAKEITESVSIPTIGIGAGRFCDGQILVIHDLLGLENRRKPKFVKRYANMGEEVKKAVSEFRTEVSNGTYPEIEQVFEPMSESEKKKAKANLKLMRG